MYGSGSGKDSMSIKLSDLAGGKKCVDGTTSSAVHRLTTEALLWVPSIRLGLGLTNMIHNYTEDLALNP